MPLSVTNLETAIAKSKELRPRTKELYLRHVRAFLTYAGSDTDGWSTETVQAWIGDMQNRDISPQSANVALNALHYAARQAKCRFFEANVCRLPVKRIETPVRNSDALSWAHAKRLLAICGGGRGRDIRDTAIITLGLRTGMLRFSLCHLQISDLATKRKLTFIKKGGDQHTILLDTVTFDAVKAWVVWLSVHGVKDGFLFRSLGRQAVGGGPAVIGDRLTPDGLYKALRDRASEAGLNDPKPHVFRKSFLNWSKRVGATCGQIAVVTGHRSDGVGEGSDVVDPPANILLPNWDAAKLEPDE